MDFTLWEFYSGMSDNFPTVFFWGGCGTVGTIQLLNRNRATHTHSLLRFSLLKEVHLTCDRTLSVGRERFKIGIPSCLLLAYVDRLMTETGRQECRVRRVPYTTNEEAACRVEYTTSSSAFILYTL